MNKPFLLVTCAAWTRREALRVIAQQSSAIVGLEQRFKQLDNNGDGKITTDELPHSPFFKQRDRTATA